MHLLCSIVCHANVQSTLDTYTTRFIFPTQSILWKSTQLDHSYRYYILKHCRSTDYSGAMVQFNVQNRASTHKICLSSIGLRCRIISIRRNTQVSCTTLSKIIFGQNGLVNIDTVYFFYVHFLL